MGNLIGMKNIVRVEKAQDIAAAGRDAGVEGRSLSPILLEDRDDPAAVSGDDVARAVGRAVVDDNHLHFGIGLLESAVDGGAEKAAIIVIVDQNTDEWPGEPGTIDGAGYPGNPYRPLLTEITSV